MIILAVIKNMKCSNTFKVRIGHKVDMAFIAAIMFFVTQPAYVQATTHDAYLLMGVHYGLSMLIPIIAAILFVFLLIIYLLRFIAKATFLRWAFSIVLAGAAFYLSNILFYIH
ncbi:conjugal transfer protein [Bartonella sp. B30(2025)]